MKYRYLPHGSLEWIDTAGMVSLSLVLSWNDVPLVDAVMIPFAVYVVLKLLREVRP